MEDEIFDETKVDDRTDKEYEYLLFLFEQLLDKFDNQTIDLEEFQEIVEARVMFAFGHCVRRFGIDLNEELDIVRNHDESYLTPLRSKKKGSCCRFRQSCRFRYRRGDTNVHGHGRTK